MRDRIRRALQERAARRQRAGRARAIVCEQPVREVMGMAPFHPELLLNEIGEYGQPPFICWERELLDDGIDSDAIAIAEIWEPGS